MTPVIDKTQARFETRRDFTRLFDELEQKMESSGQSEVEVLVSREGYDLARTFLNKPRLTIRLTHNQPR